MSTRLRVGEALEPITVGGQRVLRPRPFQGTVAPVVGCARELAYLAACCDPSLPMVFPLMLGPPGLGKSTITLHFAHNVLKLPTFHFSCHPDLGAEEVLANPRIRSNSDIEIILTPVTAALTHSSSVLIVEDCHLLSSAGWSSFMPLLSETRWIESSMLATRILAKPDHRIIFTGNETLSLPDAIRSRLKPVIKMSTSRAEIEAVITARFSINGEAPALSKAFWKAWPTNRDPSIRDVVSVFTLAQRLAKHSQGANPPILISEACLREAIGLVHSVEEDT